MVLVACTVLSTAIPQKEIRPKAQSLKCYDCTCKTLPCSCDEFDTVTDDNTYCTILVDYSGDRASATFGHVNRNSTQVYIRDLPYILVEESIIFSDQLGRWSTRTNVVLYGCNWDSCNAPRLVQYLPEGFKMELPEKWLNDTVLGDKTTIRDCHHCPDAPQCGSETFLDTSRCPVKECSTTCIVSDTFNDPSKGELCYQSRCVLPEEESQIDSHHVELEGILYLNNETKKVELWEIDIYCRADDCSRPEIFQELKASLKSDFGDASVFENLKPGSTAATTMNIIFNGSIVSLAVLFSTLLKY